MPLPFHEEKNTLYRTLMQTNSRFLEEYIKGYKTKFNIDRTRLNIRKSTCVTTRGIPSAAEPVEEGVGEGYSCPVWGAPPLPLVDRYTPVKTVLSCVCNIRGG